MQFVQIILIVLGRIEIYKVFEVLRTFGYINRTR